MKPVYEVVSLSAHSITVDVSALANESLFFNATEMAKHFGKRPDDFWKQEQNRDYLEALITLSGGNKNRDDFIVARKGKYGGSYYHNDLALQFARWLSPMFAVQLDQWVKARIKQESEWQRERLESKTGFLPMTNAIQLAHDPVKPYHYSNECNMINRIALGMSAKEFKLKYGTDSVRDHVTPTEIEAITLLQQTNTGLISIGMTYQERKKHLTTLHENRFPRIAA